MAEQEDIHPETLKETPPELLLGLFYGVVGVITSYGWHLIGLGIVGGFAWHKWLGPRYEAWLTEREERAYSAKYHKDPDVERVRQAGVEAARRRMQEENDRKAALFAERQRERNEVKRREKDAERERLGHKVTGGNRLGSIQNPDPPNVTTNNLRNTFRSEYNPLGGGGGSSGYRAPRRGGCPGGGCG